MAIKKWLQAVQDVEEELLIIDGHFEQALVEVFVGLLAMHAHGIGE